MKLTKAQIARMNGAKSKGPVTAEGKAKSSQNAVKHGMRAYNAFVLGNESKATFDELCDDLARTHQPVGDHENHLAWQIAGVIWRERRLWETETALIDLEMDKQNLQLPAQANGKTDEPLRTAHAFKALADESRALHLLVRYQNSLVRQRVSALETLRTLQAERLSLEPAPIPEHPQPAEVQPEEVEVTERTQPPSATPAVVMSSPSSSLLNTTHLGTISSLNPRVTDCIDNYGGA